MKQVRLVLYLCTLTLGCLLATHTEAATPQEEYVLQRVAAGKEADLLERSVFNQMNDQKHLELARKKGLQRYLTDLEKLDPAKKEDFLNKYGKYIQIRSEFLENLLNGPLKEKVHRKGVKIKNAIFTKKLDLKSAKVPFDVSLDNCVLDSYVNFVDSKFESNLTMEYCDFKGSCYFQKMIVDKTAYFKGTQFRKLINMSSAKIGISLNMEASTFFSWTCFDSAKIEENAYFGEKAIFYGPLNFSRAKVGGELDFGSEDEGATFHRELNLSYLKVGSHLALRGAIVLNRAQFDRADIKGDLLASRAWFLDSKKYAGFPGMKIGNLADLRGSLFKGPVDFDGMKIGSELKANKAKFEYHNDKKPLTAIGLKVGTIAHFEDAVFQGPVNFSGGRIDGMFNAAGAEFRSKSEANFSGMNVGQLAQFTNTKFHGPVKFEGSIVGGKLIANVKKETTGTKFIGAVFGDECTPGKVFFKDAHLTDLELRGIEERPLNLNELELSRLKVDRDLIIESAKIESLEASNLQVDGKACLQNVTITKKADFSYSHLGILELVVKYKGSAPNKSEPSEEGTEDSSKSLELVGLQEKTELIIDGMVYKGLCPREEDYHRTKWIELLKRCRFDAANYKQLEKYFVNLGYESDGDRVHIAMQRHWLLNPDAWYEWINPIFWMKNIFWDRLAGYGRTPFNLLWPAAVFIVIGMFAFNPMYLQGDTWYQKGRFYRGLCRFILSLQLFTPMVNVGMEWDPKEGEEEEKHVPHWILIYKHIHILAGWLLVPIFLAAIATQFK